MNIGRWAFAMWPGLPQLWWRGDWSALAVAGGFALLLNLVLLSTFVWTELVAWPVAAMAWMLVGGCWLASLIGYWRCRIRHGSKRVTQQDLFPAAVAEYLKGNWYDAEQICQELLRNNDRDVDALLLIATACRHTLRYDEAGQRLADLEKLEASSKWRWEIRDEGDRLRQARQAALAAAEQSAKAEAELRGAA